MVFWRVKSLDAILAKAEKKIFIVPLERGN